jgi:hypothetical protein
VPAFTWDNVVDFLPSAFFAFDANFETIIDDKLPHIEDMVVHCCLIAGFGAPPSGPAVEFLVAPVAKTVLAFPFG